MVSLVGHPETSHRSGGSSSVTRYAGEVVYIYAFDVAYEMARLPVRELLGHPLAQLAEEEAYTVFCIESPVQTKEGTPLSAEDWLKIHRREVASLLTQEPDVDHLSQQEADESTGRYLSYYDHDLVVVDWDAALIMDEPQNFDETLYVMELANLQLAELEAYDRILDGALERSYRDLGEQPLRRKGDVFRELREIRVDLA